MVREVHPHGPRAARYRLAPDLNNPYRSRSGGWLRVRALVDGKPVANQLVVSGGRPSRGGRLAERRVRTDAEGVARIRITDRGQWYVKFIHMVRVPRDTVSRPI